MTVKALLESRLHVPPEIVAEIRSNHQHNAIFPIECETSLYKKKKRQLIIYSIQFFANPFALSTNFGKQNIVQPWRPKLCSNHHFVRGIMYTCTTFSAHPGTHGCLIFPFGTLGSKRSSILSQQKYSRNNPWPFHIISYILKVMTVTKIHKKELSENKPRTQQTPCHGVPCSKISQRFKGAAWPGTVPLRQVYPRRINGAGSVVSCHVCF